MQRFRDGSGIEWDVVLGRESWGGLLALFVPVAMNSDQPVRQAVLRASAYDAAANELEQLDDAALQALLDSSTIKEEGVR